MRKIILFFVVLASISYFPASAQEGDSKQALWEIFGAEEIDGGFFLVVRLGSYSKCGTMVVYSNKKRDIFLKQFDVDELKKLVGQKFYGNPKADSEFDYITIKSKECLKHEGGVGI